MDAFEPLFNFLFWVVVIYVTFRLSARYLAPWLIARFINKTQERFFGQNPHLHPEPEANEEGEVSVRSTKTEHKHQIDELGEFVEFEEVPETKKT